ncbi:pyocin activator PrtN family protein [Pseudomonas baltica]|uniref:pyocin activator PrtN family protein n=1 Tax=Pseudomonas baltica TaxID=2762576 RepID=UPI003908AF2E
MNTAFLLMAQYGARAVIPLERVCADYFSHLTPAKLRLKIDAGEIDLPLMRVDDSEKAASAVHLMALAAYLDAQCEKAKSEQLMQSKRLPFNSAAVPSHELPKPTFVPNESASDLIRLPEVKKLTGISASMIYKMISTGDFPHQVSLGDRAVAWVRGEVLEWRQMRIDSRRADP